MERLRKIISLTLVFALLLTSMPVGAFGTGNKAMAATEELNYEGFNYIINSDETITLTGISEWMGDIYFPAEINGMPVVEIGNEGSWYAPMSEVGTVYLPESIKTIWTDEFNFTIRNLEVDSVESWLNVEMKGEYFGPIFWSDNYYHHITFSSRDGSAKYNNIRIPEGITQIRDFAFFEFDLVEIDIADDVTDIGDYAFLRDEYSDDIHEIKFSENLEHIGRGAFTHCFVAGYVESLTLPDSVKTIDASAFSSCTGLRSVNLPDNLETIERSAFADCPITKVHIDSLESWMNLEVDSPNLNEIIFDTNPSLYLEGELLDIVQFPEGTTNIRRDAFKGISGIKTVIIPGTVTEIEPCAFENCDDLETVIISEGVTKLHYGNLANPDTFRGCDSLKTVLLPSSLSFTSTATPENFFAGNHNATFYVPLDAEDLFATLTEDGFNCKGKAESVNIINLPTKTTYEIGEELDLTGLVIEAVYGNGVSKELEDGFVTYGFDSSEVGTCTVNVIAEGAIASFDISVTKEIKEISFEPDKTIYKVGDTCDLIGKEIIAKSGYEGSVEERVTIDETMVSGFDTTTPGVKVVEISYCGKTVSYKIGVSATGNAFDDVLDVKYPNDQTEFPYTGKNIEPEFEVSFGGTTLVLDEDYTITFVNNKKRGQATAIITGLGEYCGSIEKNFDIISGVIPTPYIDDSDVVYDGTKKTPAVVIEGLTEGFDYVVNYSNNINAGKATATITGIGNYSGTVEAKYTIHPAELPDPVLEFTSAMYDGTKKLPKVEVEGLTEGVHYTVSGNAIAAGDGTIYIYGIGNYGGIIKKSFKINLPFGYKAIKDEDDLDSMTPTGNYVLMNDIYFSASDFNAGGYYYNGGQGWDVIGTKSEPFSGTFDGNGHSILRLQVKPYDLSSSTTVYAGLFGYVTGTVKNLHLSDVTIAPMTKYGGIYAGIIAGYVDGGTIENCSVSGEFDCLASAGTLTVGGIVGGANAGKITNCRNKADVIVMGNSSIEIGGIAGKTTGGSISGCVNQNEIGGLAAFIDAGGIVGRSSSAISKCYNLGAVKGNCRTGGIVGCFEQSGSISACYNIGNVSHIKAPAQNVTATVGGIAGTMSAGTSLKDCWNAGSILDSTSGATYVGGLAGMAASTTTTVEDSYNVGLTKKGSNSSSRADAIVGMGGINTVENCYYIKGSVSGENATAVEGQQLMNAETYKDFDFNNTWEIGDENYLFAYLKGMPVTKEVEDFTLPAKMTLTIGETKTLTTATGSFPNSGFIILSSAKNIVSRSGDTVKGVNVGKTTLEVKSYFGNKSSTCEITVEPFELTTSNVSLDKSTLEYTGTEIKPTVKIGNFVEGKDYTVEYSNNVSVGTATVTVTGRGNCTGTVEKTFTIVKGNMTGIQAVGKTATYNGKAQTITLTGVPEEAEVYYKTSSNGTYTTTKPTRTSVGTTTVYYKVSKENYEDVTGSAKIVVNKASMTGIKATGKTATYNGKAQTITISGVPSGAKVYYKTSSGGKYTTTKPTRTSAGTTTVYYKVTKANYNDVTGSVKIVIKPRVISKASLAKTIYVYSGKANKPTAVVKNSSGTKLKNGTDYTVAYKNNTNVGKATVTVKGKGNYKGTISKTFTINPKATKITSLTKGSKAFTVKWSKVTTQTSGYQIYYTTSTTRKNGKTYTVSSNKTTSKKITKLKSKKKYYVWVRTYKTVNGTKYYSEWSVRKYVVTK